MVGNLVDLSRYARSSEEKLGQMKFTIAELYRVNGDSIQQRGVIPDIVLPVAESNDDHGEKKFDNALPWSHIAPADYKPVANSEFDKFLTQFRKLYEHRIHSDAEFSLLIKGLRFHDSGERKTSISLLAAKRIEKQTEKQKVSKTPFFCATDKFVQEYGNESHCKDVGGTVFATRGLAQAEHNRLKAALDGSTDKDKPSITIPDWDSPEWIAVYSKYSKDYGIELADFKFAEQWGVMDGIRLGCGARGDGYFLVLGKYFRAKGYEFLPLQMAYVFAQPKDILPSYCETDEAKKWVILQSAILNLWDTKGVGFAITDQVIKEFEQLIDSRYFGSKESTKKKIKKEDTGRDR